MKERLKEWLLRKLVADLIKRMYGVHLMTIIVEEQLDVWYEDNSYAAHSLLAHQLDVAVERVRIKGDPLL